MISYIQGTANLLKGNHLPSQILAMSGVLLDSPGDYLTIWE